MSNVSTDGSSTPAGEPEDDFFSSWDKPSIKRPTPPVSRTATPPVVGRTPSPFLNAGNSNGNGIARSSSPLVNVEGAGSAAPAHSRITSSAALRKGTTTGAGPRKANVLGAKKTKLGAKKVTGDVIDFDAAERKAKEEAERIAKLGYDPEAEEATTKATITTKTADLPKIVSPTPVSPGRAGYGSAAGRERTNSELERLGMGMGRLGFGQIGGNKAAAAPKKMGGFGSVGPIKATQEGKNIDVGIKALLSTPVKSLALKKVSPPTSSLERELSTRTHNQKPSNASKDSKVLRLSLLMHTLADLKKRMVVKTMVTWKAQQRTSCASSVLLPVTIWRT
jgi:ADP-ribosylation factor GTPase-activating protein 2/3